MAHAAQPIVHLVNPMWNAFGGSERRARDLYRVLARFGPVDVWAAPGPLDARLAAEVPIHVAGVETPRGGALVILGVYFDLGDWLRRVAPERVILLVNTPVTTAVVEFRILQLLALTGRAVEVVYASQSLADVIGLPGTVELSALDVDWFTPAPDAVARAGFTVGRLSRDRPRKHHPGDPELYARLARRGMNVRVMGGLSLADRCDPAISLSETGSVDAREFLWGLDCFLYRTAPGFAETFGRVVMEAMASGVPVVCGRPGGYSDYISHGEDGFLFDDADEAFALITELRARPALRSAIGRAARAKAVALYAGFAERIADFYFGGNLAS